MPQALAAGRFAAGNLTAPMPSRGFARLICGRWSGGYPLLSTSQCTDAFESNVVTFVGAASIAWYAGPPGQNCGVLVHHIPPTGTRQAQREGSCHEPAFALHRRRGSLSSDPVLA